MIIFTHDVVVLLFRYLYDDLDEATTLDLSKHDPVANGRVTTFVPDPSGARRLTMASYNVTP